MKYFCFLFVFAFLIQPRALAQSANQDDLSNRSEIEDEATELGDLRGTQSPQESPGTLIDEEFQALAPYDNQVAVKSPRKVAVKPRSARVKASLPVNVAVEKKDVTPDERLIQARLDHAKRELQLVQLQKEIAELRIALAQRDSVARVTVQDRMKIEQARKVRDELKKQLRKTGKLRVASVNRY